MDAAASIAFEIEVLRCLSAEVLECGASRYDAL
jgi:hypothetical protein